MWKHRLKLFLRESYARLLYHTGLHRVVDRLAAPRLVILAGHCVEDPANEHLPRDMVVPPERMRAMLAWFGERYRLCTVSEGWDEVRSGGARGGLLALTMDDGYRDNATTLLPLLKQTGAPATVYVETEVLDERRLNWSHKYFWCTAERGEEAFVRALCERCEEAPVRTALEAALSNGERLGYRVKRVLKYDADPDARDRAVDEVFRAFGGDEASLCERLFMSWDDVRALAEGGVEVGAHTRRHPVLGRLDDAAQRDEIGGSADALERALGARPRSFAYPFGRRWDVNEASAREAEAAGFETAVTSHSGTNERGAGPYDLQRVCIDGSFRMHLLVAELCGGFALLRRLGLDWSE